MLLLAKAALLHHRALEWFASVAEIGTATAFVADEETAHSASAVRCDGRPPSCAKRSTTTPFLEMNTFGETRSCRARTYTWRWRTNWATRSCFDGSRLIAFDARTRRASWPYSLPPACRAWLAQPSIQLRQWNAARSGGHASSRRSGSCRTSPLGLADAALCRACQSFWCPQNPIEPIAVIIPTRDNGSDVKRFVESLREKADSAGRFPHRSRR